MFYVLYLLKLVQMYKTYEKYGFSTVHKNNEGMIWKNQALCITGNKILNILQLVW